MTSTNSQPAVSTPQVAVNDIGSREDLLAAIDETIKYFNDGDIVEGTVVKVDHDEVLLDIGYKTEGVILSRELSIKHDVNPDDVVAVGDQIEALVLQKEDKEGRLLLSKKRAQYERAWGQIEKVKEEDGVVTGTVIEVVKGGLILDIGLRGFLPASLVEMRRVRDLAPYIGREIEAKIIELDKNRNNVVLSRRAWLEQTQSEVRTNFLHTLQKGQVRSGVVSSIVNFGAFVDLGGVDGLVHVSELSWKHIDHPSEVVEVGQEVTVEVLDVDMDRERVSLSLKATQEDPWQTFARTHAIGQVVPGKVTKLVPFGAFVRVEDGIEGLVHISELAQRHVELPEQVVKVGDEVKAGQEIASSGDTGHAYGCHLHFEVRPGTDWGNQDNVTDPQAWLKERNIDVTKEKDGLSPHAAAVSTGNSSSAVEITRGAQDMNSKPLESWNTWVGASSGARIGVGLSSLVVALIALTVPGILALLTAILSVVLQLYILIVPFAAIALMTSTHQGISFAKKYGKMALYLYFARIALGLLLTLSVVFVLWGYKIMASSGFWWGVVVMALLSFALWKMKNRVLALAETYAGGLVSKPVGVLNRIGLATKRVTGIGTASVVSGVTAKRAGGSFLKAASSAAADKKRDIANESKFGRFTTRASNKANEFAPSRLLKPQGHTPTVDEPDLLVCSNCKRTYKHGEINMFVDSLTNRMYCQRCKSDGLVPDSELLKPIKNKADEKKAKPRMKPIKDTYLTMALAQPELQRENVKSEADAFTAYKVLTTAAADSMARHHRSALDERQQSVIVYELPEAFKPYFNVDAFNVARDSDNFEKMRRHWGLAIHKYIESELGYKINRTPEETLNDIVRTSDGYSPWWKLDPNAKRGNDDEQSK